MIGKLSKIVATLGPASDSPEMIKDLIESGVNVFRFNTKHSSPEWHEERIKRVQKIADEIKATIGILVDLQGPELRIETRNGEEISVEKNGTIRMEASFSSDVCQLVIPHQAVLDALEIGDAVLIDDGKISLEVVHKTSIAVDLKADKNLKIGHRKGVNLPGKKISLPSLIQADLTQLDMMAMNKVDFVALSFVRDRHDVEILREELTKRKIEAKIIVKIENREALNHLDELIEASDAVMVARGDLGVEVPIEELAYWQKIIINKCRKAYKPVITATELLDSMINRPRPTRAEATDVSNAVFDGTDALMLSGETATGSYPVEAVRIMSKIARFTETVKPMDARRERVLDQTQLVGMAAMEMLVNRGIKVDKIIIFTQSGYTARVISSFRTAVPIVVVTNIKSTAEAMTLSYGVKSYTQKFPSGEFNSSSEAVKKLMVVGAISKGENILIVHGANWMEPGMTNSISFIKV